MNLAERSLSELFPEKFGDYDVSLKYSGKFSCYNGNVRLRNKTLVFGLSREWKNVSEEIQMGLIQLLILKVLKRKKNTNYIDLYHGFIKKIHIAIPKTESVPELEGSFSRVNKKYFDELLEMPNLAWCNSVSKLGSYEYGSDRISISRILNGKPELLDYVMYHEMLHKKLKFDAKSVRSVHHTKKFRDDERCFDDSEKYERELRNLVRKRKLADMFF